MGLFDFFRRRRERESVQSAIGQIQNQGGSVSFGEGAGTGGATVETQNLSGDWKDLLGAFAGGDVSVTQAQQSIDLRNVSGLREGVLDALRQHGIDPENPGQVNAADVPGLQEALMQAFQSHGIDFGNLAGMAQGGIQIDASGAGASGLGDSQQVAAQLKQLDELKAQGVLSDAEYQQQRQRVLDQL
jgi:hypothetical protein